MGCSPIPYCLHPVLRVRRLFIVIQNSYINLQNGSVGFVGIVFKMCQNQNITWTFGDEVLNKVCSVEIWSSALFMTVFMLGVVASALIF
jgi:hypothetical protein